MLKANIGSMKFTQQAARPDTTFEALRHQAKDAGLRKLGNGVFGITFEHPTDRRLVIKIGRESIKTKRSTNEMVRGPWTDWTLSSQAELSATFRPVVVSLDSYIHHVDGELSYIAVMERLQPLDMDIREADTIVAMLDKSAKSLAGFRGNILNDSAMFTCEAAKDTATLIKGLWKYHGDDLHQGNMMVRVVNGKRMPVITDPVV